MSQECLDFFVEDLFVRKKFRTFPPNRKSQELAVWTKNAKPGEEKVPGRFDKIAS